MVGDWLVGEGAVFSLAFSMLYQLGDLERKESQ
jgi:hypothetical protein